MKKITVFLLAAVLLLGLFGCKSSTTLQAEKDSVAPSKDLPDGTYSAAFTAADLTKDGDGWKLNVRIADYDRFEAEKVKALQPGDVICVAGKDVTIETVEGTGDYIEINGGCEKGGVSLSAEDGKYRALAEDGQSLFYEKGAVELPIDPSFMCSDQHGDQMEALPVLTEFSDLPGSLDTPDAPEWTFRDTQISVIDGKIVMILRLPTF